MSLAQRLEEAPVRAVREALPGADAWIVGGTVRDALLGRPLRDVDLALAGDAAEAARSVAGALGGPAFPLSEAFGAWRVIAADRSFVCDLSPLQAATIEEDLGRRDFSVNAIAQPLSGGDPVDPHGGMADVQAGVLRVLGERAYADDPLRPLRLVRLAAELDFEPEQRTEELTASWASRVPEAAGERIWAELRRLVGSNGAVRGVELAERLGVLASVLPEVQALRGVEQSQFHHLDVYDHTLEVLRREIELERRLGEVFGELGPRLGALIEEPLADELTRGQGLRFGALLHDIGKPETRAVRDDGRITFLGHDAVGEGMVRALCRRLRAGGRFASFVAGLTRHHLVLGFLVHQRPLTRRTVYRYLKTCSPVEVEVTLLSCADRLATRGKNADAAIDAHLRLARALMAEALAWRASGPPRAPLRGDELAQELGIEPGPELGRLLERLEEEAFAGEAGTREQALEIARRLRAEPG